MRTRSWVQSEVDVRPLEVSNMSCMRGWLVCIPSFLVVEMVSSPSGCLYFGRGRADPSMVTSLKCRVRSYMASARNINEVNCVRDHDRCVRTTRIRRDRRPQQWRSTTGMENRRTERRHKVRIPCFVDRTKQSLVADKIYVSRLIPNTTRDVLEVPASTIGVNISIDRWRNSQR